MALVLANRVQETSNTTGTGTLTLAGAVPGFQSFAAGIGSGNTCYYTITNVAGSWEVGIGTVGTGTLARTTLLSSSTGSFISFTGALNVFVTYPSEKSVNLDAAGVVTGYPITVADNVFTLQDNLDPTKQAQFQLSSLPTASTFTYVLPTGNNVSASNLVDQQSTQTLTGIKTFSGGVTFSAASGSYGTNANASTYNYASGATTTGLTKTVNVGTGGLSGSTTAITVGSANGSTTTMLGTTVIGGAAGNQSLQVNNVASAVDYLQITGNSGGFPNLSGQGASANVSIVYGTKGTGGHFFTTSASSTVQFVVSHTASAVNYAQFTGAATGSPIIISAQGSDTNVNLAYAPKGTGRHTFFSNSGTQLVVGNTASAVNYAQIDGAATGAAPTISAQGSDGTVGLNFTTKGNNTLQFQTNSGSATAFKMTTAGVTTANYFQTEASNTGISPKLYVLGTDTDISLQLVAKGAGSIVTNNPISSNSTVTAVGGVYVGSSNQRMYQGSATSLSFQVGTTPSFFSFTDNAGVAGFSTTNPFLFTGTGGTSTFKIGSLASSVNFIQVDPALTTAAPTIYALGSDANINLTLTPKGTGTLQFGTYTAGILAQAGYITITDAGGTSRRLLVG